MHLQPDISSSSSCMPRLTPATVNHASRISRHLPLLLRECRDIHSAQNELRWLREFIDEKQRHPSQATAAAPFLTGAKSAVSQKEQHNGTSLRNLVRRRARGEPLQYILGTQPFGHLDILCRPNVLIPRPDTETYTAEIARLWNILQQDERAPELSVADFCCGTGCISLLLHSIFRPPAQPHRTTSPLQIHGFDISDYALALARDNLQHNLHLKTLHETAAEEIHFEKLDLLALCQQPPKTIIDRLRDNTKHRSAEPHFDIIISNPPYIDPKDFQPGGNTTKSVRKYEPELALVPPPTLTFEEVNRADQFYPALLRIASATRPKLLAMEVGDTMQALRVRDLCRWYLRHVDGFQLDGEGRPTPLIEIWRDDGSILSDLHKREYACEAAPLRDGIHTANLEHDALVNVDLTTDSNSNSDSDVDCRVVVLWLDPSWILFRQTHLEKS